VFSLDDIPKLSGVADSRTWADIFAYDKSDTGTLEGLLRFLSEIPQDDTGD